MIPKTAPGRGYYHHPHFKMGTLSHRKDSALGPKVTAWGRSRTGGHTQGVWLQHPHPQPRGGTAASCQVSTQAGSENPLRDLQESPPQRCGHADARSFPGAGPHTLSPPQGCGISTRWAQRWVPGGPHGTRGQSPPSLGGRGLPCWPGNGDSDRMTPSFMETLWVPGTDRQAGLHPPCQNHSEAALTATRMARSKTTNGNRCW